MTDILAWHFTSGKLRDGRAIPPDGETLHHDGELVLCERGLHASVRLIDALQYAPGETICRVRCSGTIVQGDDKLICSERTILWRLNGEKLLREFARKAALDVIHLWDAPVIVRQYLETGDETIRAAARDAAWDAARAAARDAARAAARDAAWDAARDAARAWDAARDAARAAARDAWDAARDAAWDAARDAWDAARDAAWDASLDRFNTHLTAMVEAAHNAQGHA